MQEAEPTQKIEPFWLAECLDPKRFGSLNVLPTSVLSFVKDPGLIDLLTPRRRLSEVLKSALFIDFAALLQSSWENGDIQDAVDPGPHRGLHVGFIGNKGLKVQVVSDTDAKDPKGVRRNAMRWIYGKDVGTWQILPHPIPVQAPDDNRNLLFDAITYVSIATICALLSHLVGDLAMNNLSKTDTSAEAYRGTFYSWMTAYEALYLALPSDFIAAHPARSDTIRIFAEQKAELAKLVSSIKRSSRCTSSVKGFADYVSHIAESLPVSKNKVSTLLLCRALLYNVNDVVNHTGGGRASSSAPGPSGGGMSAVDTLKRAAKLGALEGASSKAIDKMMEKLGPGIAAVVPELNQDEIRLAIGGLVFPFMLMKFMDTGFIKIGESKEAKLRSFLAHIMMGSSTKVSRDVQDRLIDAFLSQATEFMKSATGTDDALTEIFNSVQEAIQEPVLEFAS